MIAWLNRKIKSYIIQKAGQHRSVDIIEVKVKEIGLLSVKSETILKLENFFFLPIEIQSIHADLYNGEVVVGEMNFDTPQKVPKKSSVTISTSSEISIITSLFQMISNLLSQPISLRSVGVARLKILWWEVEIPVDDTFKILPHQLKMKKDETEEEKKLRIEQEEIRRKKREEERAVRNQEWEERKLKYEEERLLRKEKRMERLSEIKENALKRKYKENYIPKEEREQQKLQEKSAVEEGTIIPYQAIETTPLEEIKEDVLNHDQDIATS